MTSKGLFEILPSFDKITNENNFGFYTGTKTRIEHCLWNIADATFKNYKGPALVVVDQLLGRLRVSSVAIDWWDQLFFVLADELQTSCLTTCSRHDTVE